jgi:hypothetical protein
LLPLVLMDRDAEHDQCDTRNVRPAAAASATGSPGRTATS